MGRLRFVEKARCSSSRRALPPAGGDEISFFPATRASEKTPLSPQTCAPCACAAADCIFSKKRLRFFEACRGLSTRRAPRSVWNGALFYAVFMLFSCRQACRLLRTSSTTASAPAQARAMPSGAAADASSSAGITSCKPPSVPACTTGSASASTCRISSYG